MAVREILRLGNPVLYEVSAPITFEEHPDMAEVVQDLHDTMMSFRECWGAGRAIAAPQIGVQRRLLYMNVGEPVAFLNPVIVEASDERMEVWDDCMCFPELLVKVSRHRRITLGYRDLEWRERTMTLEDDLSELIQHELDHLDGILAVQRALDERSFMLRAERDAATKARSH